MAEPEADYQALERFVAENDEFLELEERLGRFSIFDALRIERVEIRHSNCLAWLLDSNESHGQGDLFLKALLMDVLKQAPPNVRPLSPVHLDGVDLTGVEVRREWRNIDILIYCKEPELVVAIENKVDSGEHSNQLQRYENVVDAEFGATPKLFVFLTIEGDEPSDREWIAYSYARVHRVLSRAKRSAGGSPGGDVATFLNHYLNLIESRLMKDPRIEELCRRIYTNHRRALDLIFEHRPDPGLAVIVELGNRLKACPDRWLVTHPRSKSVSFVPPSWKELLPPIGTHAPNEPWQWLSMAFDAYPDALYLIVYAGPTSDVELRTRVVDALLKVPEFGFGSRSKKTLDNQWRQLRSVQCATWTTDAEGMPAVVDAALARLDELDSQLRRLPEIVRPIIEGRARPD